MQQTSLSQSAADSGAPGGALRFAFVRSLPITVSYLFTSAAYGILFTQTLPRADLAGLASIIDYAGAFQFVLVTLLGAGASAATIALTALFMNIRHIFYGISFIDDFKKTGKLYPYMIMTLTDETYSLLSSISEYPKGIDKPKAQFLIQLFSHLSWITGSIIGAIAGQVIPYDMTGIDYCLTALFITILVDQWRSAASHIPTLIGIGLAILMLLILGPDAFLLPTLIGSVGVLLLCRPILTKPDAGA